MEGFFHFGGLISSRSCSELRKPCLGRGELEGVRADISYPLKYLFRFKISTNDSGTQRKFLSR